MKTSALRQRSALPRHLPVARVSRRRGAISFVLLALSFFLTIVGSVGCDAATLTVTLPGQGDGSVNSSPAGITCPGSCSGAFSAATLIANPSANSIFRGWAGACAGLQDCAVFLTGDRTVEAWFDLKPSTVQVGGAFPGALSAACQKVASGGTVKVAARDQAGDLVLDQGYHFTLDGGYDDAFTVHSGITKLHGMLRIKSGGVRVRSVAIAPSVLSPVAPPSGITALAVAGEVSLSWDDVLGATSYNVYYSTTPGVTRATGTQLAGVASGDVIPGLAGGTTYYFVVTAVSPTGESVESAQVFVSTTPAQPAPPAAPEGVAALADNGKIKLTWEAVAGAVSYNIYWKTSAGVTTANGTKISGVSAPPYSHTGLTNGAKYYYVVTANTATGEGPASDEVSAKPTASTKPQLVKLSVYKGTLLQQTTITEYNDAGKKIKESMYDFAQNQKGYVTYEYNDKGKVSKKSTYAQGILMSYITYEYNSDGKVTQTSTFNPFVNNVLPTDYTMTSYDSAGNVTEIYRYNGYSRLPMSWTSNEYDTSNNMTKSSSYSYAGDGEHDSWILTGYEVMEYVDGNEVKRSSYTPSVDTFVVSEYVITTYNKDKLPETETTYNGYTDSVTDSNEYQYNQDKDLVTAFSYNFNHMLTDYITTEYFAPHFPSKVIDHGIGPVIKGMVIMEYGYLD